mgnify:CR=1 FL=1|tara:strand:+ start:440 stop:1126 length:687 start_codon:yes stop_codon:yes gene_type:complete
MQQIYKIFTVCIFSLFFSLSSFSHVQHYENLNSIEFDIYRNNKNIGKHIFSFKRSGDQLTVNSEINFVIKKFGATLYKYHVKGSEIYKNGKLIKFNSKTLQNKKSKFVNLDLIDNEFLIDGSSFKGKVPNDYILGTWWNHSIVEAKAQISAVSGRIIEQNVTFLGKETLEINGNQYKTLHFNFSSSDPKLKKDKKLNTDVWYDEKTLSWVKASFNKKGYWEYKLVSMK